MIDGCKHKNTSASVDCLELVISLKCNDCGKTKASRKLTEEEINKIIEKELGRYGN